MRTKQTSCIWVKPTRYESNRKRPAHTSKEISLCFDTLLLCHYFHIIWTDFKPSLMTPYLRICHSPLILHSLTIPCKSLHDSLLTHFSSFIYPGWSQRPYIGMVLQHILLWDFIFCCMAIWPVITIQDYIFHACNQPRAISFKWKYCSQTKDENYWNMSKSPTLKKIMETISLMPPHFQERWGMWGGIGRKEFTPSARVHFLVFLGNLARFGKGMTCLKP